MSFYPYTIVHSLNYPTDFDENKNKVKLRSCSTLSHIHKALHLSFGVCRPTDSFLLIYEACENL